MRKTGYYESVGSQQCFIPYPLPPKDPELKLDPELIQLHSQAVFNLGQLNGMIGAIPDTRRFINAYVLKEAILSSAIEGIHTTLLEVFTQPLLSSKPRKETQLILNYKKALDHAIMLVKDQNYPISSRILRESHALLLEQGAHDPGHFRRQQVRVGNLVPPPAPAIAQLMSDLEQFINTDQTALPLIQAGLAHVQFETIHPFLDGNGRIGRLLIVLMLVDKGMISAPLLYPSYYFKKYSSDYYRSLDRVRTAGDFEEWIKFYLLVIKESSADAYIRAKDIEALHKNLTELIRKQDLSQKMEQLRLNALSILFSSPTITVTELEAQLGSSYNTARQIINEFLSLSIIVQGDKKERGQFFNFLHYIEILEKEYGM